MEGKNLILYGWRAARINARLMILARGSFHLLHNKLLIISPRRNAHIVLGWHASHATFFIKKIPRRAIISLVN